MTTQKEEKEVWYKLMSYNPKDSLNKSISDVIATYTQKYGEPPSILLVNPSITLPEGLQIVVKVDQYVPVGVMLAGEVPQEIEVTYEG